MSLDYDKAKSKVEDAHGNSWTAYSDLFMMLSTVFLLLYVSVGLRSQTSGIAAHEELKQLKEKNADLEQQIQVYNTLRDNHLKTEAPEQEQEVYQKLMSKLSLLQEEAKDEKNKLNQQAKTNEEKEYALNEYQKLIRNIINTNVLSKTQLQKRDVIIAKKETINHEQAEVIDEQSDQIAELNQTVEQREALILANKEKINKTNNELRARIQQVKEQQKNAEISRSQMEEKIANLKTKSTQHISKLAQQNQAAQAELAEAQNKLNQTSNQLNETEKQLNESEKGRGRALASVEGLQKDLKHAREIANAKKELAKRIREELKKAGLSGQVDEKTGDVTLAFGEEYFDTGSASLKPSMMKTLQKFMPGYSSSLFTDNKIAKNIENVEIIGFASSTYAGRYVPPDSLDPNDREAINYNLKLSFNRADAIFRHIFDTNKMQFKHQKDLLPKIKVVGRGYLPDGKSGKDFPPGMPEKTFCSKFNCKQAQKVIIKFKLQD